MTIQYVSCQPRCPFASCSEKTTVQHYCLFLEHLQFLGPKQCSLGYLNVTLFTIGFIFGVIMFMNFCFHNPWLGIPHASALDVLAFTERIRDSKTSFRDFESKIIQVRSVQSSLRWGVFVSRKCVQTMGEMLSFPSSAKLLLSVRFRSSCPFWLKKLINWRFSLWSNWWSFRPSEIFSLLSTSGKLNFSPGVQMICRWVNFVVITLQRTNRWDDLTFCAQRYNSGLWSQKILIGCGHPMMKCS